MWKSGLILLLVAALARAMVENCVKSWVPTMMVEMYGLSATWASIQTAVVYICNVAGVFLLVKLFGRIKNATLTQLIYFLICLPAYVLMLFIGKISLWTTFFMLIITTTVTFALTNLNVRIAVAFDKYGYSGTVSGIMNAVICFGIVIGNVGYGIVAEQYGWNAVTVLWLVFCIVAILVSIPSVFLWKKFLHEK